jgi:hypothetical protein
LGEKKAKKIRLPQARRRIKEKKGIILKKETGSAGKPAIDIGKTAPILPVKWVAKKLYIEPDKMLPWVL